MTIIVLRFLVTLLAAFALVGTSADDFFGDTATTCSTEFNSVLSCFVTQGVTNTTLEDASKAGECQACIEGQDTIKNEDQLKEASCDEVEKAVGDALTLCGAKCEIGGCTTELSSLMSCAFKGSVECKESGAILSTFGLVSGIATFMMVFVA